MSSTTGHEALTQEGREHGRIVSFFVGLTCYLSWLHLMYFSGFGSFYAEHSGIWSLLPPVAILFTVIGVALSPKIDRIAHGPWLTCIGCIAGSIGTILIVFGGPSLQLVGLVATMIFGQTCIFILLGQIYAQFKDTGRLLVCFYGSTIASFVFYLVGFVLPTIVTAGMCATLPTVSGVSLFIAMGPQDNKTTDLGQKGRPVTALKGLPVPPIAYAYIVIASVALNYVITLLGEDLLSSEVEGLRPDAIVYASLIICAAALFDKAASLHRITATPFMILFLTMLALAMKSSGETSYILPALPVTLAAYFLFASTAMFMVGSSMAEGNYFGSRPVMLGIGANMLGLALGNAIAFAAANSIPLLGSLAIAVATCLFAMVSLFVLPSSSIRSLYKMAGIEKVEKTQPNEYVNAMVEAIHSQSMEAAEHFGLTEREGEVLRYLLRGWELQSIADEMNLSRNTVKTYVSRTYRKLGVHTREECAMVVQCLGRRSEN